MKKYFPYIALSLLLSCQSSIDRNQIVGKWYRFESPTTFMVFEFKENDLFTANSSLYSDQGSWTLDDNLILLNDPIGGNGSSLKVSLIKDNKLLIEEKGGQPWDIKLTKAQNFTQFLEHVNHLELRSDLNSKISLEPWRNAFNIYLTLKSDSILMQLDDKWENQEYEEALKNYIQSLPQDIQDGAKIFLFADKEISDKKLNAIISEIKNKIPNRIYLVLNTNIPDYSLEGILWKTQKIK